MNVSPQLSSSSSSNEGEQQYDNKFKLLEFQNQL